MEHKFKIGLYENDVLKEELAEEYKINKYPHVYQSDF